ncbi:MAG: hypothetical protein KTR17_11060 [Cellvibrionaceae bacterium]|nr:hypothetical protein [Cellvibrionaceae bacterium]
MLAQINQWIDDTNQAFKEKRVSCDFLSTAFAGYYQRPFLENAFYVCLEKLPKPDFPQLRQAGFGDFIDMQANAITYKNVYYILPSAMAIERVHFHELVHVAQWQHLGDLAFIERYMAEIQHCGYADAPLEKMAYALDTVYAQAGAKIDVLAHVKESL